MTSLSWGSFAKETYDFKESTTYSHPIVTHKLIERNPPPRGGFPIYYVPSSRTKSKRTPLEEFVPGASRRVFLLTVLDEGT